MANNLFSYIYLYIKLKTLDQILASAVDFKGKELSHFTGLDG
jgi:hypothetical protein